MWKMSTIETMLGRDEGMAEARAEVEVEVMELLEVEDQIIVGKKVQEPDSTLRYEERLEGQFAYFCWWVDAAPKQANPERSF